MPLTREMIDAMVAAGLSPEQMAALLKADVAADEARRAAKRANNAERQRRFRARNASNALQRVTERDGLQKDAEPLTSSVEGNQKPQEKEKEPPKGVSQKKVSDWPTDFEPVTWVEYGQGREKKASIQALRELERSGRVPWETFIGGVRRQAQNVEPQFRPSLERFIKRERWLDDYEPEAATGPPMEAKPMQRQLSLVNGNRQHVQAVKPSFTDVLHARIAAREGG